MAIINTISTSFLENTKRIEAEFYQPIYLKTKRIIEDKNSKTLRQLHAQIIHPTEIKRIYVKKGIQILLAQNIRDNYLDFSNEVFMPSNVESLIKRNKLSKFEKLL